MRLVKEIPAVVIEYEIIPDETDIISHKLMDLIDEKKIDLVITTGGTGVSPRDVTPDATLGIIEKEIPGMAEAMRRESSAKTPYGMISRAVVGIRKQSLIVNLPGSPRGAKENFSAILPALKHTIDKIKGDETDCAV
jgi:molybdenum cofactor synthesis domain-containing protein